MNLRPLIGTRVNLSISGSDSAGIGYPPSQVNRLVLQFVAALAGQGASVVFGHDWRPDGVMEAVHGFARQASGPLPARTNPGTTTLLVNLVPWPDSPMLAPDEQERLRDTLSIEEAGLPPELLKVDDKARHADHESEIFIYVRARGLTHLRRRLNAISDARVCIGGPEKAAGRYPGIVEEALVALDDGIPLYVSGLLGGVAAQLAGALQGEPMPNEFAAKTRAGRLYREAPVKECSANTANDRNFDPRRIWEMFGKHGIRGLCDRNRLTPDENHELLTTRVAERVITLVMTGVGRLARESNS